MARDLKLKVVYEDDWLAVVDKPAGVLVHPVRPGHSGGPAAGLREPTLVEVVHKKWPALKQLDPKRGGLVHRLDRDTSGLLIIAKTKPALAALRRQFKARQVTKRYQALVHGVPRQAEAAIDAPIARGSTGLKRGLRPAGKPAQTRYKVIKKFDRFALLEVGITTGRTHQIRVHLAALGHPVAGDSMYGKNEAALGRQFLHAAELQFQHPQTGKVITVKSPLPSELNKFLTERI